MKISAVVNTRNEEKNIANCLATLRWCDEIVVVDMESTDRTVEIALEYTDRIYSHPTVMAFDIAKKFAVEKASGEWVLVIDADEMVPFSLAQQLRTLSHRQDIDIVKIPFRHYIFGARIEHSGWGDTPLPRFFRKEAVVISGLVHDYMSCQGTKILTLEATEENAISHFNYLDCAHFLEKLNRYTTIEAHQLHGQRARFRVLELLNSSTRQFLWRYIKLKGYRDGFRGFALCLLMAFYRAVVQIKLWEKYEFAEVPVNDHYEFVRRNLLAKWEACDR